MRPRVAAQSASCPPAECPIAMTRDKSSRCAADTFRSASMPAPATGVRSELGTCRREPRFYPRVGELASSRCCRGGSRARVRAAHRRRAPLAEPDAGARGRTRFRVGQHRCPQGGSCPGALHVGHEVAPALRLGGVGQSGEDHNDSRCDPHCHPRCQRASFSPAVRPRLWRRRSSSSASLPRRHASPQRHRPRMRPSIRAA